MSSKRSSQRYEKYKAVEWGSSNEGWCEQVYVLIHCLDGQCPSLRWCQLRGTGVKW